MYRGATAEMISLCIAQNAVRFTSMNNLTTGKIITRTLDADTPLSADERAMLARLAAMPYSDIDCSDIPLSSPDAKWMRPGGPPVVIAQERKSRH
jgi:hypothetical protein